LPGISGASLIIDDKPRGNTPFAAPLLTEEGEHEVRFGREGYVPVVRGWPRSLRRDRSPNGVGGYDIWRAARTAFDTPFSFVRSEFVNTARHETSGSPRRAPL
jgi:hypothetical protein